jgi:hypothetical protein
MALPWTSATQSAFRNDASLPRADVSGLYPLWENTAELERDGALSFGLTGVRLGLRDTAHIGIEPILFAYRVPNAHAKFRLWDSGPLAGAFQLGGYLLLENATRSTLSPMYNTRLDNPDFSLLVLPASFSVTWRANDRIALHQTLTAQAYAADARLENGMMAGYSAMVSFAASPKHSLSLHGGEVGFWDHDFTWLGASYRYQGKNFEFRIGQFYRFTRGGAQDAPAINLTYTL